MSNWLPKLAQYSKAMNSSAASQRAASPDSSQDLLTEPVFQDHRSYPSDFDSGLEFICRVQGNNGAYVPRYENQLLLCGGEAACLRFLSLKRIHKFYKRLERRPVFEIANF